MIYIHFFFQNYYSIWFIIIIRPFLFVFAWIKNMHKTNVIKQTSTWLGDYLHQHLSHRSHKKKPNKLHSCYAVSIFLSKHANFEGLFQLFLFHFLLRAFLLIVLCIVWKFSFIISSFIFDSLKQISFSPSTKCTFHFDLIPFFNKHYMRWGRN